MKKRMKYLIFSLMLSVVLVSCNTGTNPKIEAENRNEEKFKNMEENLSKNLVDAYSSGLYEQKVAELAKNKASNKEVKALANKLVASHKAINNELSQVASSKQISLPSDLTQAQQDKIDRLKEKKTQEFDKEFIEQMEDEHKDAIDLYEKISNQSTDEQIKSWATKNLPMLREHMDIIITLNKQFNENNNNVNGKKNTKDNRQSKR